MAFVIKKSPEDFVVEEVPLSAWSQSGEYAIFQMRKRRYTTYKAIQRVAARLKIDPSKVGFAGEKDRQACTVQFISVRRPQAWALAESIVIDDDLSIKHVGFSSEPLSLGMLAANRFSIRVEGVGEAASGSIRAYPVDFGVPNYFDEQRFSSSNVDIGLHLLRKEYVSAAGMIAASDEFFAQRMQTHFERSPQDAVGALAGLPRKMVLMYVHAVQSAVFNALLGCLLRKSGPHVVVPYSQGEFVFPKGEPSLPRKLPLIGFDSRVPADPAIASAWSVVDDWMGRRNVRFSDFVSRQLPFLTLDETDRPALSAVDQFRIEGSGEGWVRLAFSLSKGSYATMVVRMLDARCSV
ncbi:MAG: tRNA pseudouridine(13) synthase TruD [Nanoarchaeota archaeon]